MTAPRPTDDKATDYETSRREAMAAARHAIIALRLAAGVPEAALAHGYKVTAGCVTDDLGRVSAAISNYFLDAEPALRDRLAAVERERDELKARIREIDLNWWRVGFTRRLEPTERVLLARAVAAERERDEARADLAVWVETWKAAANGVLRLMGEKEAAERERDVAKAETVLVRGAARKRISDVEQCLGDARARAVAAEARLAAFRGALQRHAIAARAASDFEAERRALDLLAIDDRAAAASPQAEPATCPHGWTCWHTYAEADYDPMSPANLGKVCPGPQSTEETQP